MQASKDSTIVYGSLFLIYLCIEGFFIYTVERHENVVVLSLFTLLFGLYTIFFVRKEFKINWIIGAGIIARLLLFFAEPNLSDDFYRFIWDGRLINAGINPFLFKPSFFMNDTATIEGITPELFGLLNSPDYFTIYPPLSQLVFSISTQFSPSNMMGSVLIMRSFIVLADVGIMVVLAKILQHYGRSSRFLMVYALNPLVIIELTGNLHFEGLMVFFLVLSIWLLITRQHLFSSAFMALSICTKLFPLMLLPGLFHHIKFRKLAIYYILTGASVVAIFLITLDVEFLLGLGDSLSLFFKKFEFNGGIFFLVREVGFWIKGYDIVGQLGPALAILALELIIIYVFVGAKRHVNIGLVFATILFIQLSLATTVHPWYVIPLLVMGCISGLYFPVVWSFLIFLTYWGYHETGYNQPFIAMSIEYLIVIPYAIYELHNKHKTTDNVTT